MGYSKMISAAIKMAHLTGLNVYVFKEEELLYSNEEIVIPSYMPGANRADVIDFRQKMDERRKVYCYINSWGLFYLGYAFSDNNKQHAIMIGPYFEITPNLYDLQVQHRLSSRQSIELRNITEKIKVLAREPVRSYESVLRQFESMKEIETTPTVLRAEQRVPAEVKQQDRLDEEADLVEQRYEVENNFMHAVENGDKEAALEQISSDNMLFSFSKRFPNQPIRRLKNLTIVLNTLLRTGARNGRVPAIQIHHISEKFAFEIEKGESIAEIQQLQDRMIIAYCDLVKKHSLKKYSYTIQRAIEYITTYYDQPIDKKELAKHCYTHPGNLSRKFKGETGTTITAYQQSLRIDQAKHLLKSKSLPIDEIGWIVGYEDTSYFGRVFKQVTGLTPSEYRKHDR